MTTTGKETPAGFTLLRTFQGHKDVITRIAWSPDGKCLASPSVGKNIFIWNMQTGQLLQTLVGHSDRVNSVAWSPNRPILASGSFDGTVRLWETETGQLLQTLIKHSRWVNSVAWSPNGQVLASGSVDGDVRLWDAQTGQLLSVLSRQFSSVNNLAWSLDGQILASCSDNGTIQLWDVQTDMLLQNLSGHTRPVFGVGWVPPKSTLLASSSNDGTIRLWETKTGHEVRVLEGHTSAVTSISFSSDGQLLASKSLDGTIRIWSTNTWESIVVLREVSSGHRTPSLTFHPTASILATLGEGDAVTRIWSLDVATLLSTPPITHSVYYTNAKVVLVGDSGVGKSGLALALTGQPYTSTDSTHGRRVWKFDSHKRMLTDERTEIRETMLWDLAGQPAYRLIHQLHLSEVAVGLVVFDSHSSTDPFAGISHWVRALRMAQYTQENSAFPIKKLLVAARIDRGTVKVSRERIEALMKKWGFNDYVETSALEGTNISLLIETTKQFIDWDHLPRVTSTDLFQRIKTFLATRKEQGLLISPSDALYREFLSSRSSTGEDVHAEFEICIGLVEAQGLIRRLSFGGLILLQPELLDSYASALINAARAEPDELGSISEEQAKSGGFLTSEGERILDRDLEKLLLIAMIEDLLRHEIALREQTYLVFPSEAVRENPDLINPEGKSIVFDFEGPIQNIYTTLAVRLSHSGPFTKHELWKDAITYKAKVGGLCGISLHSTEDGRGELTLFFDSAASEETRFQFEEYVKTHLERRALPGSIRRKRIFVCPQCKRPLDNEIVKLRLADGLHSMLCSLCEIRIPLLDGEERLAIVHALMVSATSRTEYLAEMDRTANSGVKREADLLTIQGKEATEDFDVFFCHHNVDKPAVRKIGEQLKQQGILPWLDEWQLRPGLPWQRLLEQQISKIKSAAVFIGKDGTGPWEQMELEAFLREFVKRKCPVIPVILLEAPKEPQLPIFLRGMTWVDFRKQSPDPMEQLTWGITGRKG